MILYFLYFKTSYLIIPEIITTQAFKFVLKKENKLRKYKNDGTAQKDNEKITSHHYCTVLHFSYYSTQGMASCFKII